MRPDAKPFPPPRPSHPSSSSPKQLDAFTVGLIRRKARQLVDKAGFTQSDRDDLEQELAIKLLKHMVSFDPERAPWQAFVVMVVERHAANLLRDQRAEKRDHRRATSLYLEIGSADEGPTELIETIGQREYDRRRGRSPRSDGELARLASDVAEVLTTLPAELRDLAQRLMSRSVAEIARDLQVPRTTLNGRVRRLRRRLERTGLKDYL